MNRSGNVYNSMLWSDLVSIQGINVRRMPVRKIDVVPIHPPETNSPSLPPIVRETGFKPVLLLLNLEQLNNFLSNQNTLAFLWFALLTNIAKKNI